MSRQRRFGLLAPLEERILGVMLLRPEQSWYRSELARELELPASSLQRPLAALAGAGVIRELHRKGNRIYYQADTEHPLFPELRSMIAKTSGLVDVLKEALKGVVKDGAYSGLVESIGDGLVTQRVNRDGTVVRHDESKLSDKVTAGEAVDIRYRDGVGEVKGPAKELGVGR